jgi:uncharacterized protein (DUF1330 family)
MRALLDSLVDLAEAFLRGHSAEKIRGIFQSDEYAALIPARDKAFPSMSILVAEDM